MSPRPVTEIPEVLAVELDLTPNQQILDVVILCRVTDFERGGTALAVGISPGVDWIVQRGLLGAAMDELVNQAVQDQDPGHAA